MTDWATTGSPVPAPDGDQGAESEIPLRSGEHPPVPGAIKVQVIDDGSPHHHSARTKARKAALDLLYAAESRQTDPLILLHEAELAGPVRDFTVEIVQGVVADELNLDQRIAESVIQDWTLERMPSLDRNIARIAIWELDHTDVNPQVAISEALSLAEEYSTDSSPAFLNGLLAKAVELR
jgi:N utilization substance protein B